MGGERTERECEQSAPESGLRAEREREEREREPDERSEMSEREPAERACESL
jgi:hypothetical protein